MHIRIFDNLTSLLRQAKRRRPPQAQPKAGWPCPPSAGMYGRWVPIPVRSEPELEQVLVSRGRAWRYGRD